MFQLRFFFQDWKYFGAISYPLSSNSTVKVQEKHKNIWFTAVTKKDVVLLLVVRNVRGAIQSPWQDPENFLKGEVYAFVPGTPAALISNQGCHIHL